MERSQRSDFIEWLKLNIRELCIDIKDLAAFCGLNPRTVSRYLSGEGFFKKPSDAVNFVDRAARSGLFHHIPSGEFRDLFQTLYFGMESIVTQQMIADSIGLTQATVSDYLCRTTQPLYLSTDSQLAVLKLYREHLKGKENSELSVLLDTAMDRSVYSCHTDSFLRRERCRPLAYQSFLESLLKNYFIGLEDRTVSRQDFDRERAAGAMLAIADELMFHRTSWLDSVYLEKLLNSCGAGEGAERLLARVFAEALFAGGESLLEEIRYAGTEKTCSKLAVWGKFSLKYRTAAVSQGTMSRREREQVLREESRVFSGLSSSDAALVNSHFRAFCFDGRTDLEVKREIISMLREESYPVMKRFADKLSNIEPERLMPYSVGPGLDHRQIPGNKKFYLLTELFYMTGLSEQRQRVQ